MWQELQTVDVGEHETHVVSVKRAEFIILTSVSKHVSNMFQSCFNQLRSNMLVQQFFGTIPSIVPLSVGFTGVSRLFSRTLWSHPDVAWTYPVYRCLPGWSWMDGCLFGSILCSWNLEPSRFQAPPQAFLPGGLITAGDPQNMAGTVGCQWMRWYGSIVEGLAKQSFGCKL